MTIQDIVCEELHAAISRAAERIGSAPDIDEDTLAGVPLLLLLADAVVVDAFKSWVVKQEKSAKPMPRQQVAERVLHALLRYRDSDKEDSYGWTASWLRDTAECQIGSSDTRSETLHEIAVILEEAGAL